MESKKNDTNELIYKRNSQTENKHMVIKEEEEKDKLGVWGQHIYTAAAAAAAAAKSLQSCPTP